MTFIAVCEGPGLAKSAVAAKDDLPTGLTSDEARRRLEKFGPNAMPDTALHPLRMAIEKFWAPVPWMLEASIVLGLGSRLLSRHPHAPR
jgi:H+-transporting ATPase